jgi:hypothetical protein
LTCNTGSIIAFIWSWNSRDIATVGWEGSAQSLVINTLSILTANLGNWTSIDQVAADITANATEATSRTGRACVDQRTMTNKLARTITTSFLGRRIAWNDESTLTCSEDAVS